MAARRSLRRVRILLTVFFIGLLVSGLTAFPLQWEIDLLKRFMDNAPGLTNFVPGLASWINSVHAGITATYQQYPFMAYGTDWLAFAHIVIALAFLGPIRDPVRNIWVIEFGMIACVLVIPLALIFGPLRGIPIGWQLIDCSFGVIGIIPLWLARHLTRKLTCMTEQPLIIAH
jgi:hypothetical protein